ncbi:hypothetical protein COF58_27045 [Bacillus wiedmannii]|nr:hypothetical protein COF58_27045 [Bacillus wiedmannii]
MPCLLDAVCVLFEECVVLCQTYATSLFMEAYVELINHKFLISELAVELSSVLKELNCFVQSSLPQLQSELDSQEPQSASL